MEKARRENDFAHFLPCLATDRSSSSGSRPRRWAIGRPPYDALLDDYEPEELTSNVGRVLADLREKLVPLVAAIAGSNRRPDIAVLGRIPGRRQEAFGKEAAAAIGFDFDRGRLDVTCILFASTLGPHDCRITTRYDEHFFNSAFFGILHEAGHGIYEQGVPPESSACRWAKPFRWASTNRSPGCGRTSSAAAEPSGGTSIRRPKSGSPLALGGVEPTHFTSPSTTCGRH